MAYTTPATWVAGAVLTAAQLNAQLRDNLNAAFPLGVDAWTSWTPTLVNLTLGNGTVSAKYHRIGRRICWRFKFTLGSTSAVGTLPSFTLPVPAHADYLTTDSFLGGATLIDTGVAGYGGLVVCSSGGAPIFLRVGGSGAANVAVTATAPFTWGTGDVLSANGTYESAA